MANLLQDYYDRITALNRQRGMTGNMQYGKALDASLAEGYFDSYQKNKAQSQSLANQKTALAIQQQGMNLQDKAINYDTALGFAGLGAQAIGAGMKLYLGRQPKDDQLTTQKAVTLPDYYNQGDFSESLGLPKDSTTIDYNSIKPNSDFQIEPQDYSLDWEWDFGSIA